eukprot:1053117-Prorocentrum_minimum.AAC.1
MKNVIYYTCREEQNASLFKYLRIAQSEVRAVTTATWPLRTGFVVKREQVSGVTESNLVSTAVISSKQISSKDSI